MYVASHKRYCGKQCRPRPEAAERKLEAAERRSEATGRTVGSKVYTACIQEFLFKMQNTQDYPKIWNRLFHLGRVKRIRAFHHDKF